ncbi:multidrug resistance protein [Legionella massiliensis]|uniref:Multidrug resistance protein n=1 Tax=Legionella massiliensis TaxID=1034943 RepID=A0A078KXW7_9GAMM|nr:MFS transporter [Legionella massiliensis]CDZ77806.1 multidrug resistance protein [Legionella massiliensis]CEE13544.1 Major Facilitator Superfamily protein [Legionella massiliensis]
MEYSSKSITRVYLTLILLNTLATSFIWGINTLFLLDGGLSNTEAFAANAFFTAGQVLFEVPTGVAADTWGRRLSFMLGGITLMASTLLYLFMWQISAPFWAWAAISILLGLGFTFYSGATEAWLVDALAAAKFDDVESIFAKGQIVSGIGMLTGSIAGGVIAQYTNLGVPYIFRAFFLILSFMFAFFYMFDIGFVPKQTISLLPEMKRVLSSSVKYGLKTPPIRWLMIAGIFTSGVGIYAFYALQPYLLKLYGDPSAYSIAGLAAALVAGAQIVGGLLVPYVRKLFKKRTSLLFSGVLLNSVLLFAIGYNPHFWITVFLISIWSLIFAASIPVRLAYINGIIPSDQRATVLSFDSMMSSSGGVIFQPVLGKVADVWSYSTSYLVCAIINSASWPFILLAKREKTQSDIITTKEEP